MTIKKAPIYILSCLVLFFISPSCKDDNNAVANNTYKISGAASGAQEVPSFTTAATANLTGQFDASTGDLSYSITWTGLSGDVNAMHFHGPAPAGVNAAVIYPLTVVTNGTSGTSSGSITGIPQATIQDFINGQIYYNLHTALKPGGEIRGQVIVTR
jgi:hypothetical protein